MKCNHLLILIFLTLTLLLAWSLREIIIQIFAGIILAMALCSLTGKVSNLLNLPRTIALLISLISILMLLIITLLIVVPQFSNEFQILIMQLPSAAKAILNFCYEKLNEISILISGNDATKLLENIVKLDAGKVLG